MGRILVERVAAPLRYAVTLNRLSLGGWPLGCSAEPAASSVHQPRRAPWRPKPSLASWSCQLIEQRLRVLQVWRIKAFGKPAIDRCKQILGFRALALVTPQSGEAG